MLELIGFRSVGGPIGFIGPLGVDVSRGLAEQLGFRPVCGFVHFDCLFSQLVSDTPYGFYEFSRGIDLCELLAEVSDVNHYGVSR